MVAAPQYAAMKFVGASRRTYSKDVYFSDVAAGQIRFDAGAGAGAATPEEWQAPEPVSLVDFSVVTGLTDTTKAQITRNSVPSGDILRYTIHLTSLPLRPILNIPFAKGDRISAIQLA